MGRPPLSFDIAPKHQRELAKLLSGGVPQVRVVLTALALLQLAKGASAPQIANVVPLTAEAVRNIGRRYQQGGLERALYERPRPGAAEVLADSQKQRLIAMIGSNPPEGRARWTVRLVVEEAVKRKLVPRVGRETIRILLLSHDLKPWREKNVGGLRSSQDRQKPSPKRFPGKQSSMARSCTSEKMASRDFTMSCAAGVHRCSMHSTFSGT